MKYISLCLIFSLTIAAQTKNHSVNNTVTDYFTCLKTSDVEKFDALLVKERDYQALNKSQAGVSQSRSYKDFVQTSKAEFEKVINNAKQVGVNWEKVVLDSSVLEANRGKGSELVNGKLYFRLVDNSAFYFVNIINVIVKDQHLLFSKQYSVVENIGAKNRFLTKDLKEEYISSLSKLMGKDRNWAEAQYYRETDMADGVSLVKYKIEFCKKQMARRK